MPENDYSEQLSLNGEWQIRIGEHQGTIQVPGTWEAQGYPRDRNHAVYTRHFNVPTDWQGKHVILRFGAVSYHIVVKVNGQEVGTHTGLWSSFTFDVSDVLNYGADNSIELDITKPSNSLDDEYSYRKVLVGFIPYVSTTFGGPWQDIELLAHSAPAWDNVMVQADWVTKTINIQADGKFTNRQTHTQVIIRDEAGEQVAIESYQIDENTPLNVTIPIPDARSWSPESPYLYQVQLQMLDNDNEVMTQTSRKFGFRALQANGDRLFLNGDPYLLRGILHWGWNPDALAPSPSDDFVRAEFGRVRDMGFNLVKLCLFVPSENMFRIADEEGMLLWLELPMWWQQMNPHLRKQLPVEYTDILKQLHYHPSIVIVSSGCELEAHMADATLLGELDSIIRDKTTHCLVCDNSGSGEAYKGITTDLADFYDYHFYCDIHQFIPLLDHFRRDWRTPRPWIFGEYCAYDDIRNSAQLVDENGPFWWRELLGTDGGIHRWAYREQEKRIEMLGLPFTVDELVQLARQQSWVMRKSILERTRARRHISGYVITGLRDTPINTSGVFDDFNRPKFDPALFCTINSESMLILEQGRRRVWKNGDQPAPLDLHNYVSGEQVSLYIVASHFGVQEQVQLSWQLIDPDGNRFAEANSTVAALTGDGIPQIVAEIGWIFPTIETGQIWQLQANLGDIASNTWLLYLYPESVTWKAHLTLYDPSGTIGLHNTLPLHHFDDPDQAKVLLATIWSRDIENYIVNGGKAILVQTGLGELPAIATGFWQEAAHLLYPHPVWETFPHKGYVAENFYHLAAECAFDTNALAQLLPSETRIHPVMRRLHTRLFTASDYLVDIELGKGRLLATTLRLHGGLGDQVRGLLANIAGQSLLDACIRCLLQH